MAPIHAASETEFFVKVIEAQITFRHDATGAATGLLLHHGGKSTSAKKVG